jgi:hypothetical protein
MSRIKKIVKLIHENAGIGKSHPVTCHCKNRGELEVQFYPFSTSANDRCGCSAIRSRRFIPLKKPLYQLLEVAGWAPGPIWTAMKKKRSLAPAWFRIPDYAIPGRIHEGHRMNISVKSVGRILL